MSAAETTPPDGGDGHTPVEAVIEVVDEVTSGPPPPWSKHLLSHLDGFDDAIDARVDRHLRGNVVVDRVMYSVTELADFSLLWHLLSSGKVVRDEAHLPASLRLSVVLGIESSLVNGLLKSIVKRERPIPEFERPHHLRMPLTSSFPSGHASAAFCAATLLSEGRGRAARAGWFGLAGLVASSRVHVKIHHASDVLGGAAVGLVVGQVAKRLWRLR